MPSEIPENAHKCSRKVPTKYSTKCLQSLCNVSPGPSQLFWSTDLIFPPWAVSIFVTLNVAGRSCFRVWIKWLLWFFRRKWVFSVPPHQKLLLQIAAWGFGFFCSFGVVCGFSKGNKVLLVLQFKLLQIHSLWHFGFLLALDQALNSLYNI